jgi:hypothetical protein
MLLALAHHHLELRLTWMLSWTTTGWAVIRVVTSWTLTWMITGRRGRRAVVMLLPQRAKQRKLLSE